MTGLPPFTSTTNAPIAGMAQLVVPVGQRDRGTIIPKTRANALIHEVKSFDDLPCIIAALANGKIKGLELQFPCVNEGDQAKEQIAARDFILAMPKEPK